MLWGITIALIIVAVNAIMMIANNEKVKYEKGTAIRLPKTFFVIGCIVTVAIIALTIVIKIYSSEPNDWWVYLCMFLFSLMGVYLIVYYFNWYIAVEKDYFIYRTFWRKTYKIPYENVSELKISGDAIKIKMDNKKFSIDPHAIGIDEFIEKIKSVNKNLDVITSEEIK
ncbi:hypothetical protein SDC9_155779 [bioreactor metagenome]|uniref:Uncharacterized protein n=1 Tax=bioreactor metagenome TaxID=1076179 RepID=A0A645F2Q3_9ZZZZ